MSTVEGPLKPQQVIQEEPRLGVRSKQAKPSFVANFSKPKNTEIKHIGNNWYLYAKSDKYDQRLKRTRKISGACLGKITEEGLIVSTKKIAKESDFILNDTIDVGIPIFYWKRTKNIRRRLKKYFPYLWKEIFIIALIRSTTDCRFRRINIHYENSMLARMFPKLIFTPYKIKEILNLLGKQREIISSFMKEDLELTAKYILFDGHRIISSSRTMELAELGYDSKQRHKPQLNIIYIFTLSENIGLPVYYKQFLGSTLDITAFSDILKESKINCSDYTIIGDKGFGSEDNFNLLDESRLKYVIPLKRTNSFTKGKIPSSPSEYKEIFTFNKRAIHSISFRDHQEFTIHLFFDADLYAEEIADATLKIEKINNENEKIKQREEKIRKRGKIRLTDEELEKLVPKNIADVYTNKEAMGTICIRTNRNELNACQVYNIYKQRQNIEEFFKIYGDSLEFEDSYMRNRTNFEAWLFFNHIASSISISAVEELANIESSTTITLKDLNKTLAKITASKIGENWQIAPIKKATRTLAEKLNLMVTEAEMLSILSECAGKPPKPNREGGCDATGTSGSEGQNIPKPDCNGGCDAAGTSGTEGKNIPKPDRDGGCDAARSSGCEGQDRPKPDCDRGCEATGFSECE